MKTLRISMAYVFLLLSVCLCIDTADMSLTHGHNSSYFENIKTKQKKEQLQIHIIAHSHDDVGWLKTPDQYYTGDENKIQHACVQRILDSVYKELMNDKKRRFTYVEIAFFERWWRNQTDQVRDDIRMLIKENRFVFVNGGWSMSDEATVHYEDFINNMKAGHDFLKEEFGYKPTIGWHIDPFGHHSAAAALFAEMGFNAWFFARMDHEDKERRMNNTELEFIWRPFVDSLGARAEIFSHMMYNHYKSPPTFCFDENCRDPPIIKMNVEQRAAQLHDYLLHMAEHYKTNHLFVPFGDDFNFMDAKRNFINIDRIISYMNYRYKDVNLFYSTPYDYIDAVHKADLEWPTKYDDLFPYSDNWNDYWTGFFTSRPNLKGFVREASKDFNSQSIFLALDYLINGKQTFSSFEYLYHELGVLQHHDAIAGTERQLVTNDYIKSLSDSLSEERHKFLKSYKRVSGSQIEDMALCKAHNSTYEDCPTKLLDDPNINDVFIDIINESNQRETVAKIPIPHSNVTLLNYKGREIDSDIICSEEDIRDCYIYFPVNISMWARQEFTLHKTIVDRAIKPILNQNKLQIHNYSFSLNSYDGDIDLTIRRNHKIENKISISYLYYKSFQEKVGQKSGAYIFRPSVPDQTPEYYNHFYHYESYQGKFIALFKLYGDEIDSWISGNIYSDFIEVETNLIGIPFTGVGTEVIINFSSKEIENDEVFYTDSMGLEMQKRILNYRPTWNLTVTQPISGNYYPAALGVTIKDNNYTLEVLNDRNQGVSSLKDGSIEFMIQRRIYRDDNRGLSEPLNEVLFKNPRNRGIPLSMHHYFRIYSTSQSHSVKEDFKWMQREIDVPLMYVFGTIKTLNNYKGALFNDTNNCINLPDNIKGVFLPQKDGSLFARFENIIDPISSRIASSINVKSIAQFIATRTDNLLEDVYEVSNTGLFTMSEMQKIKLKWKGNDYTSPEVDYSSDLTSIELSPQRIRTFIFKFHKLDTNQESAIKISY